MWKKWLITLAFIIGFSANDSSGISYIQWFGDEANELVTIDGTSENGVNQAESENSDSLEEEPQQSEKEDEEPERKESQEQEQEKQKENTIQEAKNTAEFDTYPKGQFAVDGAQGENVTTDTGSFTIRKQFTDVSPLNIGPITVTFEKISFISGDVTNKDISGISGEKVKFIQVDALLQNTSKDPIQFPFASTILEVNGNNLSAHDMFSGLSNVNFDTQTPRNTTLIYMLNDPSANIEAIADVTVKMIHPPINKKTEAEVGDPASIVLSF